MRRGNGVASAWARILSAAMRRPLPAVLLAAAVLTGCGGGGDKKKDEGVKSKDTVTVGHNQPIAFGASEYKFEPKNVIVNSGTTQATIVRFVMRNNGSLAHDIHVEKGGQDLGGTPIFGPGNTGSGQATLAPGTAAPASSTRTLIDALPPLRCLALPAWSVRPGRICVCHVARPAGVVNEPSTSTRPVCALASSFHASLALGGGLTVTVWPNAVTAGFDRRA